MSLLAATQIPKPADEQAFERAAIVLWRCILGDPNVHRCGRRGQAQKGVDLIGIRNSDPTHIVGIQCKLKGTGRKLIEKEVRKEVNEALKFRPELREYFIITTAPDDVELQQFAYALAGDLAAKGRQLLFYIWGWNTLEERITEYSEARNAFDPDYNSFSKKILETVNESNAKQDDIKACLADGFLAITSRLSRIESPSGDVAAVANSLESHLDAEIDELRELANGGKPRTAKSMFERLLVRVEDKASGRILFRIKANIGSCLIALGEDERAAQFLSDAYDHASTEPKAIANKALSLLIRGDWKQLLVFGAEALRADPNNDDLAGYFVQAARFDKTIDEPLYLVPEQVKKSVGVAIARIDFLRYRGRLDDWRQAARDAVVAHPSNHYVQYFAAEADIDEILQDPYFQRTALFRLGERARFTTAANILLQHWNKARESEGGVRPEQLALCNNLIVAFHMLCDLPRAIDIAKQGLAVAPDDTELIKRAVVVAIDGHDEALVCELLPRLPLDPDTTVLKFRYHAQRSEWGEVLQLYKAAASVIPVAEQVLVFTTGRLAEIKLGAWKDAEARLMAIIDEVVEDPRASIVAANFAMMAGYDKIGDAAYQNALRKINAGSHIAGRLMVAMHAAKRGDWGTVIDLLDGHIDEEHDSEELRTLTTALANENPVRKRAIRFFERLPVAISTLPFYLHAAGLICFNQGALKQAKASFEGAVKADPNLSNYLALFATLHRIDQQKKIASILKSLDLTALEGTPGQKMFLAQEVYAAGQKKRAISYAYGVLMQAPNDHEAALRYFGLLMSDPTGRLIPSMQTARVDAWIRLEGDNNESFEFIIEEGEDRPADGVLSPKHLLAVAVLGLKVDASFDQTHGFGGKTTWRVTKIKHKYLHALHDVMENFQTRFPNAKGMYRFMVRDGDIQPMLDQVKKTAEMNRKIADLYLLQRFPMVMVASRLGGDSIGFADYIRSLGANIEVCVGIEPERLTAQNMILQHREGGVVLDTYTAWTVATMDIFDILVAVFGRVIVPRSVIDELRILREKEGQFAGRAMTVAWHNGQFFRQELTKEEMEGHVRFISDQIKKIEQNCQIESVVAPDSPTELASLLVDAFGVHVLDAANLAAEGYILLSEDMYFRQIAKAAVSVNGVWLQVVLSFARDHGVTTRERYADAIAKLAFRRHSYLSLDPVTLWDVFLMDTSDLGQFRAVAEFIGTKDADVKSHVTVVLGFLRVVWSTGSCTELKDKSATGILLGQLIRHLGDDWALVFAYIKSEANRNLREYIDGWVQGHFLPTDKLREADRKIAQIYVTRGEGQA